MKSVSLQGKILTPRYVSMSNTSPFVFDYGLRDALTGLQSANPARIIPLLKRFDRNLDMDSDSYIKGMAKAMRNVFPSELVLFKDHTVDIVGTLADASGYGYVELNGESWVCVVPLALVGEKVVAQFNRYGVCPGYFYAKLISTVEKSPMRIEPKCKYYESCSACQLQHIAYPDQINWKQKLVEQRFTDFHTQTNTQQTYPIKKIVESPRQFNFRTRVSIHHGPTYPDAGIREFGFTNRHSRHTVEIDRCEAITEELNSELTTFKKDIRNNFTFSDEKKPGATYLIAHTLNPTADKITELKQLTTEGTNDATLDTAREWPETGWTSSVTTGRNEIVTNVINGQVIRFPANSFFQSNSSLIPLLTSYLSRTFKALSLAHPIKNLVDAYCGSGLFSLTVKAENKLGIDIDSHLIRWVLLFIRMTNVRPRSTPNSTDRKTRFHSLLETLPTSLAQLLNMTAMRHV